MDFKKLKAKLESIAGKNAKIVYSGAGNTGGILYKIIEVNKSGLTIMNTAHEVFIPITKVLNMDFILPAENYEELKDESEKKDIERFSSALFEPLFEKMTESLESELAKNSGDLSNSLEARVIYILEEKGVLKIDQTQSLEHKG
jgi:predicted transcriptional regulator YheO